MSFFDDIGDAIGDVASAVGEGVSTLASEAYSTALSPTDSFVMKGLGAAGSAVSDLFGDLEISDISDVAKFAAFPALGISEALGGVIAKSSLPDFFENNSIAQMLENNSITEIIRDNPLAGMAAGNIGDNIKESNQGLFDVAEMFKKEDSQKASEESKRLQENSDKINLEKMGLNLLGKKGIARALNRKF